MPAADHPATADPAVSELLYGRWLHRAHEVIAGSAAALNAMNVFPVSDSDTGSNLELTLSGITRGVSSVDRADADTIVAAAILSAHGNSGAILAEMVVSVCRLLEHAGPTTPPTPGTALAELLQTVATAATRAVARPVAGTILTVADAAAAAALAAATTTPEDALAVARAARSAAGTALSRTPDQLDVLAEAGVVDAGGQAYVLLLDVLVEVLGGERAVPLDPGTSPVATHVRTPVVGAPEYEVMYAVRGTGPAMLSALREELSVLGHSVVVVGDRTVAQVHVHLRDAGAAVEAGLAHGTLSQVRITVLTPPADATDRSDPTGPAVRTVVSVVAGPGLADAVASLGGLPVVPAGSRVSLVELTAAMESAAGDLVVLPNDMESLEVATHLAAQLRGPGRRIAVIPTVSQIQGLAAMAVHEPSADFDSALVAMSATAGHTRHGAVTVAESPAMTMAGRCEPGDVLGIVDGDFVLIGDSVAEVGRQVAQRLRSSGGELLTVVLGADAPPGLADELQARLTQGDPSAAGLEVEVVDGGQQRYPLLLGLE